MSKTYIKMVETRGVVMSGVLERFNFYDYEKWMNKKNKSKEIITISNFYGDYINRISSGLPIYRSRQKCTKCGKEKLSEYLDRSCKVINDGNT